MGGSWSTGGHGVLVGMRMSAPEGTFRNWEVRHKTSAIWLAFVI